MEGKDWSLIIPQYFLLNHSMSSYPSRSNSGPRKPNSFQKYTQSSSRQAATSSTRYELSSTTLLFFFLPLLLLTEYSGTTQATSTDPVYSFSRILCDFSIHPFAFTASRPSQTARCNQQSNAKCSRKLRISVQGKTIRFIIQAVHVYSFTPNGETFKSWQWYIGSFGIQSKSYVRPVVCFLWCLSFFILESFTILTLCYLRLPIPVSIISLTATMQPLLNKIKSLIHSSNGIWHIFLIIFFNI